MVNAIPDNYPRISPYLTVKGASDAIDFYAAVFGATERGRLAAPDGSIAHAELAIGDSVLMLADENADWGNKAPGAFGGSPVTVAVYVQDVDATVTQAAALGATVPMEPKDEFYGDRVAMVVDPFGHSWHVATHIEDVSMEEMGKRAAAMFAG